MQNLLKKVELKKFSSVFLTLSLLMQVGILIPLEVSAVTPATIFEDGFESGGGGFTNWTSGNPENGKWTADNSAKVGGNRSARVKGSNDINKTLYKEISTAGYENISVSYWYKIDGDLEKTGSNRDDFYVEWWDGTNWNELMHLIGPDEGGWIQKNHNLGVGANNNLDFKLRFRIKLTAATENIYIDDVKITGNEIKVPVQNLTLTSMCSYDGGGAKWRVRNTNNFDVPFTWEIVNNQETGSGIALGSADTFFDTNLKGTLKIYWQDENGKEKSTVKETNPALCKVEPTTATVITQKVVCESEEYLPNWGHGGADITSTTAQDYVDQSNGKCSLVEWDFEWAPNNTPNPGDNDLGQAGGVWTTFSGSVQVSPTERIWLREVMKDGYIPFSGWLKSGDNTPTEQDKISAEFYCNNDVLNYDNYEWIDNLVAGQTYHCVGFNAPVEKPLICDPNVNLIKNGDFETPVVDTAKKWNTFASGFTGLEWLVKWLNPSQNAPETSNLELHRGVNGWNTSGGENNYQYAELDTDYGAPPSNPGGSASVAIWQDIPTIPGKTYKLSFDFSPRPSTNASQNVLGVLWGGDSVVAPISKAGGANTNWETYTFDLTATTSLTSLMFRDEGTSDSFGTFLDNVSLYCEDKPTDPCTYGSQVFYSDTEHNVGEGTSVATYTHSSWVGVPTTSPAIWMWSDDEVQNPTQDEVKVFTKTFNVGGVPTSALLSLAADNSYKVVINGNEVASTTNEKNFLSFTDYDVTSKLVYGENTIEITVHNWALAGSSYKTNPAGVIYALYVDTKLCAGDNPHEPEKLQVKIYKYLNDVLATDESADGYSFPMHSTWSWPSSPQNPGSNGSGDYFLNQNGHGGSGSYSAYTSVMNAPASYSTYEKTTDVDNSSIVLPIGAQCESGKFRLIGYRVGDTLENAEDADLQTTNPSLNGLYKDMYIIVENEKCPPNGDLEIEKTGEYNKDNGTITFTIDWSVSGGPVEDIVISDDVSSEMTITQINNGGATTTPTNIEWNLGDKNDGDFGSVSFVVKVNDAPDSQTIWAHSVYDFNQGLRKNNTPVLAERSDTSKALGVAQNNDTVNFVTLGFGGEIVLHYMYPFVDGPGDDIQIYETSYGNPTFTNYPEKAEVYISKDGVNWTYVGLAELDEMLDINGAIDWAQYIKIKDVSDKSSNKFPNDADGFDVDGVKVFHAVAPVCRVSNTASFTGVSNQYNLQGQSSTLVSINPLYCDNGPIVCGEGYVSEGSQCVPIVEEILGCTDSSATNYNPFATKNDESCKYEVLIQQTLTDNTNNGTTPPGGRRRNISGLFGGAPQVLGASTDDEGLMCEPYLKEYIKFGARNNPDEVRKLQIFLNQFFELSNPITGFYGPITFEMVKKFQAHQEAGTLTPWAVAGVPTDGPTGYVYKTTKRWINILKCPEMLTTTPLPQLP